VDIKGPGQVVGEVSLDESPPPCTYSAQAKSEVGAAAAVRVPAVCWLGRT
jgi:hypothetical protein